MPIKTKKKLALAALSILGVTVVAAVAVLRADLESPLLGTELLRRANAASGMNLTANGFRLNLSRGAELRGLEARARVPGLRYDLKLETLRFRHRPLELLRGRLHIEGAVLESPRVTLRVGSDPDPRAPGAAPAPRSGLAEPVTPPDTPEVEEGSEAPTTAPFFEIALDVSELDIRNGAFLVQQTEDDVVRLLLDGVDLSLGALDFDRNAVTFLHGVTADGRIAIRELRFATTLVQDIAASIGLERGRLELDELTLENEERRWAGRLSLDANSIPFRYEIALRGGPFDALPFARSMEVRFEGRGFGVDSKNLTGAGTASLTGGTLPESAWARALEEASGRSALAGASYSSTDLAFRLESDVLRFEPFTLAVAGAAVNVTGTISLEGELDLDVMLDGLRYRVEGGVDAPRVARAR